MPWLSMCWLAGRTIRERNAFDDWLTFLMVVGLFFAGRYVYRNFWHRIPFRRKAKKTQPLATPQLDRDEPRGWSNLKERSRHVNQTSSSK